jgi:hypothetical protein
MLILLAVVFVSSVLGGEENLAIANSAGGSLRGNNPILLPFMLASWAVVKVTGVEFGPGDGVQQITPDDDDEGGFSKSEVEFEPAKQDEIEFNGVDIVGNPRDYIEVFAAVAITVIIALWASFDVTSAMRITGIKYEIIRGAAAAGYMAWLLPSRAGIRALLFVEQLAFLVIASIYVTQPMQQFEVTPIGTTGNLNVNTDVTVTIDHENTNWVWIVFLLYLPQFAWGFATALVWHGNMFAFASGVSFLVWLAEIGLIVAVSFEIRNAQPGQQLGEEYAVLALAIFAFIVSTLWFTFSSRLTYVMQKEENKIILRMSDAEAAATISEKRRV